MSHKSPSVSGSTNVDCSTSLLNASDITEPSNTNARQPSYVWAYFKKVPGKQVNKCHFIMKNGKPCGKELTRDKKSSTKSMGNHLESQHGVREEGNQSNRTDIAQLFKKIKTAHPVSLSISLCPSFKYKYGIAHHTCVPSFSAQSQQPHAQERTHTFHR